MSMKRTANNVLFPVFPTWLEVFFVCDFVQILLAYF